MKNFKLSITLGVLWTMISALACEAQNITAELQQKVVTSIGQQMKDRYVFPKVADQMANYLEKQLQAKAYQKANTPLMFASLLTRDLQKISKDKHIRVRFNPRMAKQLASGAPRKPNPDLIRQRKAQEKSRNYGFTKVEILSGNIGYVDLRGFHNPKDGAKTVESVMGFLANTEGVIFDVRRNGGGRPDMVQLICSYFFGPKPVHLNSLYWRKGDRTQEFWTLKEVKGQRMPEKPLYVLTSGNTFSAAEEFSYNLQNLKRATLIGETTGGGANPGGRFPIQNQFMVFIPTGRAINPITKTNWEGVGVVPHIKVPSSQALDKAHLDLLTKLKAKGKVSPGVDWALVGLEAKLHPKVVSQKVLKSYAGDFTNRKIIFQNNQLYYQRPGLSKQLKKMIPMGSEVFAIDGHPDFRIKFKKGSNGQIEALEGMYSSGRRDLSKRGSIKSR
ncbi:MAG TPA: hypothetical protein DCS93_13060 [Microscillaceae bacterium]|nr:hypothetical protein [Microscillaceae bacterium]